MLTQNPTWSRCEECDDVFHGCKLARYAGREYYCYGCWPELHQTRATERRTERRPENETALMSAEGTR